MSSLSNDEQIYLCPTIHKQYALNTRFLHCEDTVVNPRTKVVDFGAWIDHGTCFVAVTTPVFLWIGKMICLWDKRPYVADPNRTFLSSMGPTVVPSTYLFAE